jgi:indole-3-glycerol phosphate synthase
VLNAVSNRTKISKENRMHSRLTQILAEKCKEVEKLKRKGIPRHRDNDLIPIRDFKHAISVPNKTNLIAEIKFASPSSGIIHEKLDPITIGQMYEGAGAAAISLLTDRRFFRGDLSHLPRLRRATSLPILRKDFIIEEIQVRESFHWGADALLLIARILSRRKLKGFLGMCQSLGMAALTEVRDQSDLHKAIDCGSDIIGMNNRDLDTFKVDLATTLRLVPLVPAGHIIVSESGINTGDDVHLLREAGVHAVLVGTALMKSEDIGKKTKWLAGAAERHKGRTGGQD